MLPPFHYHLLTSIVPLEASWPPSHIRPPLGWDPILQTTLSQARLLIQAPLFKLESDSKMDPASHSWKQCRLIRRLSLPCSNINRSSWALQGLWLANLRVLTPGQGFFNFYQQKACFSSQYPCYVCLGFCVFFLVMHMHLTLPPFCFSSLTVSGTVLITLSYSIISCEGKGLMFTNHIKCFLPSLPGNPILQCMQCGNSSLLCSLN